MRVAVAQLRSGTDPAQNLALVRSWAGRASDAGARLVVFPEATMASFEAKSADVAQPLDGPFADGVRAVAAELRTTLVVGMFTPGDPAAGRPRARNTLLAVGPAGEWAYDKIHLFDAWGFAESRHVEAGSVPVVAEADGVGVGLTTCYDVRFPELHRFLAGAGARVLIVAASWAGGPGKLDQWRALVRARALDTTSVVVAAGQAEVAAAASGRPLGVGHSLVAGPHGEVLAEAGAGPELLVVDLDLTAVDAARAALPVLANARFVVTPPSGTMGEGPRAVAPRPTPPGPEGSKGK